MIERPKSQYVAPRVFIPWAENTDQSLRKSSVGFIPVYANGWDLMEDHKDADIDNAIKVPVIKQQS